MTFKFIISFLFFASIHFSIIKNCESISSNHSILHTETTINHFDNVTNAESSNNSIINNNNNTNNNNKDDVDDDDDDDNDDIDKNIIKVMDSEKNSKMSPAQYFIKRIRSIWKDILNAANAQNDDRSFIGRCFGAAKKIRQLIPYAIFGAGVLVTKLGFLMLFSLKTVALLTLLLMFNVASVAVKIGAFLASKKAEHSPQNLHLHIQPWKSDEHYSNHHYSSGWDDRNDFNTEKHQLYNLYDKLRS